MSEYSRGKHLVSLALNKELRAKVQSYKCKKRPLILKEHEDSDFEPELLVKYRINSKHPSMTNQPRISVPPPHADAEQTNTNAADAIDTYVNVILLDILEQVFQYSDFSGCISDVERYETDTVRKLSGADTRINILSDVLLLPSPDAYTVNSSERKIDSFEVLPLEDGQISYCEDDDDVEFIVKILCNDIINAAIEIAERTKYTKKGELRKRRLHTFSPLERKKLKVEKYAEAHSVKGSCSCKKKCSQKIGAARQNDINTQFWMITNKDEQKMFAMSCVKKSEKKRHTVKSGNSRRTYSFQYFLKNEKGEDIEVCKTFLLQTLGYDTENDRLLKNVRNRDPSMITPNRDGRVLRRNSSKKIDRTVILEHINSFHPTVSHYRREHAPNRLYLPSDITVTLMYKAFREKYPDINFSYELYRKEVEGLNISFTKLGHEECWECEAFDTHKIQTKHKINPEELEVLECEACEKWRTHNQKTKAARAEYRKDAENIPDDEKIIVSADLQKV